MPRSRRSPTTSLSASGVEYGSLLESLCTASGAAIANDGLTAAVAGGLAAESVV